MNQYLETIPEEYDLLKSNIRYSIRNATNDKGAIVITVPVTAKLVPKKDIAAIKRTVRGKDISSLNGILKDSLRARKITPEVQTPLFFLKNRLPFFSQNIEVIITSL